MAYDSPFLYLSNDQVAILLADENGTYSFFTSLAILQGFLNFYATNLLLPTISDFQLSQKSLEAAINSVPVQCQGTIKINRETTLDIVKMVTTKKNQDEAVMSRFVDSFMDAIVTQYRDIRGGGTTIQPKTLAAGAGW